MSFIQLPTDSTGKKVQTTIVNTDEHREHVILAGDGAQSEIVGVAVAAPVETENAIITRPIFRKDGETLSTTNLGISGVFTQTFQDSNADGVVWVTATARADVASATDGFIIQESEDSADSNFTTTVAAASVGANTTVTIRAPIRSRFWRVQYTNGGTGQASFRLAASAASVEEQQALDFDSGTGTQLVPVSGIALPASGGAVAGGTNANPVQVGDAGGSLTVDNAALSVVGGGVEASALRVTVANDSTGLLSVDDNGASLTVDNATLSVTGGGTEASALRVTLANDSTGLVSVDDNAGSLTIDNANLENATLVDNAAFTDGTTRVVMAGYIFDETAGTALTENDAAAPRIDSKRAAVSVIEDETTRGRRATVTAANALKVDGSAVTQPVSGTVTASQATASSLNAEVQGDAAHDAAVSGNPVRIGAKANTNEPTAVSADGDTVDLWADLLGRLVVLPGHPNPEAPDSSNVTASGDTTIIGAPGANLSLYICKGSVHNAGSANITVALRDGTAGTIRWQAELAAEGGGSLFDFGARGWKLTSNTLLAANLSAAGTVDINVTEYYIAA